MNALSDKQVTIYSKSWLFKLIHWKFIFPMFPNEENIIKIRYFYMELKKMEFGYY